MRRKEMQNSECRMQNEEYREGYEQGVKDMAERIKNYYRHTTSRPLPATVEYYIGQLAKEMIEDGEKESG